MECTHSHISPPVPALSLLHYSRFPAPLAARRAHHSRSCRHWLALLQTWVASRSRSPACDSPSSPALLPSERGEGSTTWTRQKAPLLSSTGRVPAKRVAVGARASVGVSVVCRTTRVLTHP